MVKLPLHALHLGLVPADPVDALGAQACWKEEENTVRANFKHLIHDGFAAAGDGRRATCGQSTAGDAVTQISDLHIYDPYRVGLADATKTLLHHKITQFVTK